MAAFVLPAVAQAQPDNGAGSGEVMFISGKAERIRADGAANSVSKGMLVLEGDRIRTQPDSHVYVRLRDGGLLVVRPASELHVELWRFDPARPQDSQIRYSLVNGVARHVSGQGAKAAREKFRFNTPMAAIGVRGTDFTVLADAKVTRVSVHSGGVIMNSLGEGCQRDALGPCEGPSAVELFAGAKDKLLQLQAGERRPQLIDDPSASPDRARPPAAAEPVAKQPAGPTEVKVADSRGSELVTGGVTLPNPPVLDPTPPVVVTPPPPTQPQQPDPPVAVWGRWAAVSEGDAGVVSAEDVLNGRNLVSINRFYVLASNPTMTSMALPGDGVGRFSLTGHEGVITDKPTGISVVSKASDGSLKIDFGSRKFETSMKVSAGDLSAWIAARGSVDPNGQFQSEAFSLIPNASIVNGIVGGKDAGEAMYLYQREFGGRYEATGATSWRK
ncbi:hypothetical protein UC35_14365 [Ramlibacter tataouinensis]|uniref:FecR protein domain-containing protein n=1 Tax=Ramlibacter tataouinensis TaxID=94132 RepID=A0A127JV29_9BURK|nr:hypothetical protein UC35_14365 [Ramlibacter tataouinensis]